MEFKEMFNANTSKSELQKVFDYNNAQVRTVIKDREPWFVAKDVCDVLEYSNHNETLKRLDDDEKGVSSIDTLGGSQEMVIINEFGLYSLILGSKKSEAKQFKRWVTHEVLPSIRKTGKYETPDFLGKLHTSMQMIRALSWHETPTVRKQHVNENLAKLKEYYHGLIDQDVANEPNPMSVFIQDYCIINQDSKIDRTYLYDGYVRWCIRNNVYPKSKIKLTEFLDEMDEVAYLRVDRKHGLNARFIGIELNEAGLKTIYN